MRLSKVLGNARIRSDQGQYVSSQNAMLENLGVVVVFTDVGNGSKRTGRDKLEAAIRLLEPGDELHRFHPDRIARYTANLLPVAKRLRIGRASVYRALAA